MERFAIEICPRRHAVKHAHEENSIAKNKNTFLKRQRELEKKTKAEEKRKIRNMRKQGSSQSDFPKADDGDSKSIEQKD